jgi:hypothetical protein
VGGIPSPFIKIYERGRDTPHPSLGPLSARNDLLHGAPALVSGELFDQLFHAREELVFGARVVREA